MLRMRKRIGAAFMAAALLIGQLGATAYAGGPPNATGGLCEHHRTHDAACGYVEAIPGHDCEHKGNGGEADREGPLGGGHTPDCYTDELICGMDGDTEQTATESDAGHHHGQECYALDCHHEHDAACGYIEAEAGTPCGYVCDQCGKEPDKDSGEAGTTGGNGLPAPEKPGTVEPEGAGTITVTAFDDLEEAVRFQTVPAGTALDDLTLPATLGALGYKVNNAEGGREISLGDTVADDTGTAPEPEPIVITGVTWEPDSPWDETAQQGGYAFTPVLPAGYALADAVELPEIDVLIGAGNMLSATPQDGYDTGDMAAFNAILDAHPSLKSITGVDRNDPASCQVFG